MHGICDVVEFGAEGPTPVEYKSGLYRAGGLADVQVTAPVLCLREMFDAGVSAGVVFSGRDRRHVVAVDVAPRLSVARRPGPDSAGRPRSARIAT